MPLVKKLLPEAFVFMILFPADFTKLFSHFCFSKAFFPNKIVPIKEAFLTTANNPFFRAEDFLFCKCVLIRSGKKCQKQFRIRKVIKTKIYFCHWKNHLFLCLQFTNEGFLFNLYITHFSDCAALSLSLLTCLSPNYFITIWGGSYASICRRSINI